MRPRGGPGGRWVAPLQGYVPKELLNGADLSWLIGGVVAGVAYLAGMRGRATAPTKEMMSSAAGS